MLAASPSHSPWTSQSSWAANKNIHIVIQCTHILQQSQLVYYFIIKPIEHVHSRHTTPGNNSQALYWRIASGLFPGV